MAVAPYRLSCNLALGSISDRLVVSSSSRPAASLFNLLTHALGVAGLVDLAVPQFLPLLAAHGVDVELALFVVTNVLLDGIAAGCDVADALRKGCTGVLRPIEIVDRLIGAVARGLLGSTGSIVGGLIGSASLRLNDRNTLAFGSMAGSAVGWSVGWVAGRLLHRNWRRLLAVRFRSNDRRPMSSVQGALEPVENSDPVCRRPAAASLD